ncbi:hypothetical protein SMACR_02852 [Sordaria macrospora]|uniref:WGS project CABT00000000 data, contig 2.12 n=2 Tax=Sordaria macrospora TaxID=5147 RepID=F7VXN1_SORMK|nr:uncharacterized protein SMAC_02852 [Sordaria macrospora k-hell]KAA8632823.1 hypothetical protein SMACR_02852 [Sordaria macrospora]KAH7635031.1 autophagy protein Apg6-domain-containing protein [Sordaria sp. MPI-SDFR-AT-0083]WPJ58206.1 hypothetical protein SMAC4_02852 [Sordaria macrospora]CCC10275.1 unnamed protein product [Sordaria macrospora k-hell]
MNCQKCRTPLKLDSSLEDLNPAAYDLLVATHSQQAPKKALSSISESSTTHRSPHDRERRSLYEKALRSSHQPMFKRHAGPGRGGGDGTHRDNPAMSFVLLTESQIDASPLQRNNRSSAQDLPSDTYNSNNNASEEDDMANAHLSDQMERISKLFEVISARSDIDHPICIECSDILVEEMQKKLEAANREKDAYVNYLKELKASEPTDEEIRAQEEATRKAKQVEMELLEELKALEQEQAALEKEKLDLEAEIREVDIKEEEFWRGRNAFNTTLGDFQNERDSINSKFDHDSRQLEKLQRSNVFNDTFCISHDGTFATINGLRLGRMHNIPVDWPEINAAWGHALLLLVTVAEKLNFRFEGYEPQPMGSTSRIVRIEPASTSMASSFYPSRPVDANAPPPPAKRTVLELYSSGDFPLGFTFIHRKFDTAMVAFLELVRQLGVHVQEQTRREGNPLSLPYQIQGDKISDVSIKLGVQQDDSWAKACKLTLTCCKFLLAHASNVSASSTARANALGL